MGAGAGCQGSGSGAAVHVGNPSSPRHNELTSQQRAQLVAGGPSHSAPMRGCVSCVTALINLRKCTGQSPPLVPTDPAWQHTARVSALFGACELQSAEGWVVLDVASVATRRCGPQVANRTFTAPQACEAARAPPSVKLCITLGYWPSCQLRHFFETTARRIRGRETIAHSRRAEPVKLGNVEAGRLARTRCEY